MARRLILDTGVLVAAERGTANLADVVLADDDLAISAVTVAELRTGVELASVDRRPGRAEFLSSVLETLPVEPYGVEIAEAHGRLLAHVYRTGRKPGAHDLMIAATAVATGRTILTTDRNARFEELPDVDYIVVG